MNLETKNSKERLALFGGTFDPPHLGHLHIAEEARAQCSLGRVIFVPCRISPHKKEIASASAEHRCEMLRLCLEDKPWAEISRLELDRPEPSYSWQTAAHFAAEFPDADLCWILGQDQWAVLDSWARPEILRKLLTFIVFPRDGDRPEPRTGYRSEILANTHPASATEIRRALAAGAHEDSLLHPAVDAYITEHGLYQSPES